MTLIRRHFEKYRSREPWPFCWRVALEATLLSFVVGSVLGLLFGATDRGFMNLPVFPVLVLVLAVAPVAETLLLQALPISASRLLGLGLRSQLTVSTVLFTLAHCLEGVAVGVAAGLIGGFYLAFTYAHWAARSHFTAYWVTMVSHFIRNSIACAILLSSGVIGANGIEFCAVGGGKESAWYFYTPQYDFLFAVGGGEGKSRRPIRGGNHFDHRLYGEFSIEIGSRRRRFEYDRESNSVKIGGVPYGLAEGNVFLLRSEDNGQEVRQITIHVDKERFRERRGFHVIELIEEQLEELDAENR